MTSMPSNPSAHIASLSRLIRIYAFNEPICVWPKISFTVSMGTSWFMPESLFHRVEQYVEAHNGVSKRVFVVGLVAQELQSWLMEQSPDEVQDQEFGPDQDEQGFGMSMTM